MKRAQVAYKNATRVYHMQEDMYFSNDLHEMLMEKDTVSFWETWNSKMVKNKMSAVIVESDKFTRHFQQNWSSHNNK